MRGVSARYPAFNAAKGRPIDIEQRINLCRTEKQNATPLPFESRNSVVGLSASNLCGDTEPFERKGRNETVRSVLCDVCVRS